MPPDLLQIALEHHRAGRLRQAEAGYRAIVESDPGNADAPHWLGVLFFQAGRADEALPWLERAAALRPDDPAFQYNLGHACLSCGLADRAIDVLQQAARLGPRRGETLMLLGLARLSRGRDGEAAVADLRAAIETGLDSAEIHHHLGVGLIAAKLPDEAIGSLRAALSRKTDYPSAYHHLAAAYRQKGEPREVRKNLIKALELDPRLARAWYDLAMLDVESGNLAVAAGLFRKSAAANPDFAPAWRELGQALQKLGHKAESARAYEQAARATRGEPTPQTGPGALPGKGSEQKPSIADLERKLNAADAVNLHFALASRYSVFTPAMLPQPSLSKLFNEYAHNFDEMLVDKLQYRVPELLARAVAAARQGPISPDARPPDAKLIDVLDLGCGTGLCGRLLRPIAARMAGVDLSPAMIEKAKARGVYDQLEAADLLEMLKRSPRSFDLIVAADVFIYTGDLAAVFEAASACLRPGGLFAFSVEAGGGDRYNLTIKTRRYTHSAPYLRHLAAICGFDEVSFDTIIVRIERGEDVPGFLPVLRFPG